MSNPEFESRDANETSGTFKSRRSLLWLGGIAILVVGFLAAAIILPATAEVPGAGGPDVQVPKMQNVPPEQAPKMKLELERQPEER